MIGSEPWERVDPRAHRRGAALSVVIATAWVGLAVWRPTVTYHLAPPLVAGAWPWTLRTRALRASIVDTRRAAIGATGIALLAAVVILAFDAMRGPTLWDRGHPMIEVGPAAVIGAVIGYRYSRCSPPG